MLATQPLPHPACAAISDGTKAFSEGAENVRGALLLLGVWLQPCMEAALWRGW